MTKRAAAVAVALGLCAAVLDADTLVLRDGRRVDGQLVAVRDDVVEFRDRGRRLLRLGRDDVRAIELDDRGGFASSRPDPAGAGSRPRGLREREVIVSGDVPFVDSGIDVQPGQRLYFESIGNVWWRRNRKDGPDGNSSLPYNPKLPMPRRPVAALIGKIGQDSPDLFFIGSDPGPMRVPTAGRLFLGVNDDYFEDNHGNFRVVVFY